MPTITQQQYRNFIERQEEVERELNVLKSVMHQAVIEEDLINPAMLQKWEKISIKLDKGKGHSFSSLRKMREWLVGL